MNEPENEDVRGEYREFDAEEPDCQQEFARRVQPIEAVLNIACTLYVRSIFTA
jgi:hypothetical protein